MSEIYESKAPFEVWCLFHNDSDGCTYSSEFLLSVYLTKGDAETGLLKLIEDAQRLTAENAEFERRIKKCHETRDYHVGLGAAIEEQRAWRVKNFGNEFGDIPDLNIDNYSIEPMEIGVIRRG